MNNDFQRIFEPLRRKLLDEVLRRLKQARENANSSDESFVIDASRIRDGLLDSAFTQELSDLFCPLTIEDVREALLSQIAGVDERSPQPSISRFEKHLKWLLVDPGKTSATEKLPLGAWTIDGIEVDGDNCGTLWNSGSGFFLELYGDFGLYTTLDVNEANYFDLEDYIDENPQPDYPVVAGIHVRLIGKEATSRAGARFETVVAGVWRTVSLLLAFAFSEGSKLSFNESWGSELFDGEADGLSLALLAPFEVNFDPRPPLSRLLSDEGGLLCDMCLRALMEKSSTKLDARIVNALSLFDESRKQTNDALGLSLSVAATEAILCDDQPGLSEREQVASRAAALLESRALHRPEAIESVRSLYNRRSMALHGESIEQMPNHRLNATRLAAGIIRVYFQWQRYQESMGDQVHRDEFLKEVTNAYQTGTIVVGVSEE